MKTPNFFIVGAPKCGTTALSEYLRSHPQVFMCTPKEPHFFAEDFPGNRHVETWEDYLRLFSGAGLDCTAIGEASALYLYSSVAIPSLLERFPEARLIIMLRNPVEMVRSRHAQSLYDGNETVSSFEKAWRLCEARRCGEMVPRHCRDIKTLLYDQIALLGFQLQRVLNHVPRNQVKWCFFDDFFVRPEDVYREVLTFIGVDDDGRTEFPRINLRKAHRSRLLGQFVQKPPQVLIDGAMRVKRVLGLQCWGVLESLRNINKSRREPQPLPQEFAAEIRDWFASDVRLLASITGRSLEHWLQ